MKTPQPGRPRTPADIAKAINQGSLSIADAFHQDYSRSLSPQHPHLRVVPEELRNALLAAGELVEAQACRELAGLVAGAYFQLNPWPDDDDPAVRAVCEDLLLAGRMIAGRQDLNPAMPEVDRICGGRSTHCVAALGVWR